MEQSGFWCRKQDTSWCSHGSIKEGASQSTLRSIKSSAATCAIARDREISKRVTHSVDIKITSQQHTRRTLPFRASPWPEDC